MISLKKYLTGGSGSAEELLHVVHLLVQSVGLHAVEEDQAACANFRRDIELALGALEASTRAADVFTHTATAMRAMEDYNRAVTERIRAKTAEFKHMLKMFAATVESLSHASAENISSLRTLEGKLTTACEVQDIHNLKLQISECLDAIRAESQRQEERTARNLEQMSQDLRSAKEMAAAMGITDPVTGLPVRFEAETAIRESAAKGQKYFAGVMVIDRVQLVNQRFGRDAGDQILREITRTLHTQMLPGDRLFRWTGPCFVLLFNRPGNPENIRTEMRHMLECRQEHNVQTPTRGVLFSVAARWTILPPNASSAAFLQAIDSFAAAAPGPE